MKGKFESDNTNSIFVTMEYMNYKKLHKMLKYLSSFSSKWGLSQGDMLMPQPDTGPVDTFTQ